MRVMGSVWQWFSTCGPGTPGGSGCLSEGPPGPHCFHSDTQMWFTFFTVILSHVYSVVFQRVCGVWWRHSPGSGYRKVCFMLFYFSNNSFHRPHNSITVYRSVDFSIFRVVVAFIRADFCAFLSCTHLQSFLSPLVSLCPRQPLTASCLITFALSGRYR